MRPSTIRWPCLIDALRHKAQEQGERVSFVFLDDGERESERLSFAALDLRARAIAAHLESLSAAGERALLLYPQSLDFVTAFWGCLYAGVIPVPAKTPNVRRNDARLVTMLSDAGATLAFATPTLQSKISAGPTSDSFGNVRWLHTAEIANDTAADWREPDIRPDSLALLQYTSGSTSAPKGVMITHENLINNCVEADLGSVHTADSTIVTWLPTFHDLGLVYGVVQPVYSGIRCCMMAPAAFLMRPFRWLRAMSEYRASHTSAPNFAFDLCVEKVTAEQQTTLDLSHWRVSLIGAEPVRERTMRRFAERFASSGFDPKTLCPGYGLAEATMRVSCVRNRAGYRVFKARLDSLSRHEVLEAGESEDGQAIVGCGPTESDTEIVIVNPLTRRRCPPDEIGEIWIRGRSVASGYWKKPEDTKRVFGGFLADTLEGPFLQTGDFGFLRDGEVFVTGRIKDVLIFRGLNHYPTDIELTVESCHPALRPNCGAAFSVDIDGEERLVIVQEIEREFLRSVVANEVFAAIRQAVSEENELQPYAVLLIRTGSLPKTSSGKVQRHACRDAFLTGTLDSIQQWRQSDEVSVLPEPFNHSAEEIEFRIAAAVASLLKVDPGAIDPQQPFAMYGMDSLAAVALAAELTEWLGYELSPTIAYECPTVASLARSLAAPRNVDGATAAVTDSVSSSSGSAGAPKRPSGVKAPSGFNSTATNSGPLVREPIAIIGMACRLPRANGLDEFWRLLREGMDAITEVPASRWDMDSLYDRQPGKPGKSNTRWGGFLDDVEYFDAGFFGISPREAENMDPQQRLLLEVSWEALEHAAISPERLAGTSTGVFVGVSGIDYIGYQLGRTDVNAYVGTGTGLSIAANRISYSLDLRGPSMIVDTACSSSLVAIHNACRSLRAGESEQALAGGVNLILAPEFTVAISQARMTAADGRCKTFDASADGYVRSEGCGIVVLKCLSHAVRDGNRILGVIRGSAVNQDGRSNGLTAPNAAAQVSVIRRALDDAGVEPARIGYVEAHGTGTALGDPIEMSSLKEALAPGRNEPFWVGSVKTNIGHVEAAAGVAGLIKVVLALQHKEIPQHLHFRKLNPHISGAGAVFQIPTAHQEWIANGSSRIAGISSFGFGGTNGHLIVEEYAEGRTPEIDHEVDRPLHILAVSAKSEDALKQLAHRYAEHLPVHSECTIADAAYTANAGRAQLNYRRAVVGASTADVIAKLSEPAAVEPVSTRVKVGFLFTGQGSQYRYMGRSLYETQPHFRETLDRCAEILGRYLDRPLIELLYGASGSETLLRQTAYTQPALFALEYALAELWRSWGIEPAAALGHSVGEYTAACVAGVFSLEDGLKLIAERGKQMQALPENGEMAAARTSEEIALRTIHRLGEGRVAVASLNGPFATVLSGERSHVAAVCQALKSEGIATQPLRVSHAFHSPLMEPMLETFAHAASGIQYKRPRLRLISNVSGGWAGPEVAAPDYWVRHVIEPVRFADGMKQISGECDAFLEIGPAPVLIAMARNCVEDEQRRLWQSSLKPGRPDWEPMLESLARLWERGVEVDWAGFDRDYKRRHISLPTYPFQRRRYWLAKTKTIASYRQDIPVIDLIQQGNVRGLTELVTRSGRVECEAETVSGVIKALLHEYRQQTIDASIEEDFYDVVWKAAAPKSPFGKLEPGFWLIFTDRAGIATSLAALLKQSGQAVSLAQWPEDAEQLEVFLQRAIADADAPLKGVLYACALDTPPVEDLSLKDLAHLAEHHCESAIRLTHAIARLQLSPAPRLWLLTQNTVPVGAGGATGIAQSPLSGIGKVLALEYPDIFGGAIDIGGDAGEEPLILSSIVGAQGETQVALRGCDRYVARVVRNKPSIPRPFKFSPDETYLITGGTGALGLHIANWMIESGARHLLLTARREPSETAAARLRTLEQLGAEIVTMQADSGSEQDMTRVFERIRSLAHPLGGIIHGAGIVTPDPHRLHDVMHPKVAGAWILHNLSFDFDIRFFVCLSSIASVWGSKGLARYAAANQFLDTLAHYRRRLGLCGLSVNWGPWAGGGMSATEISNFSRFGIDAFSPDLACAALGRLLGSELTQSILARVDWDLFKAAYESRAQRSLFEEIEVKVEAPKSSQPVWEVITSIEEPAERRRSLIEHVQLEVANILKLGLSELPSLEQGFFAMGMDSLMAVELRRRLEAGLAISLPATIAFECPNIQALVLHLETVLGWQEVSARQHAAQTPIDHRNGNGRPTGKYEEETEEEIEAGIAHRLARLEALVRKE